jgi:hypothetical protein
MGLEQNKNSVGNFKQLRRIRLRNRQINRDNLISSFGIHTGQEAVMNEGSNQRLPLLHESGKVTFTRVCHWAIPITTFCNHMLQTHSAVHRLFVRNCAHFTALLPGLDLAAASPP